MGPQKAPKVSAIREGGAAGKDGAAGQCNASDREQCSSTVSGKVCWGFDRECGRWW